MKKQREWNPQCVHLKSFSHLVCLPQYLQFDLTAQKIRKENGEVNERSYPSLRPSCHCFLTWETCTENRRQQ